MGSQRVRHNWAHIHTHTHTHTHTFWSDSCLREISQHNEGRIEHRVCKHGRNLKVLRGRLIFIEDLQWASYCARLLTCYHSYWLLQVYGIGIIILIQEMKLNNVSKITQLGGRGAELWFCSDSKATVLSFTSKWMMRVWIMPAAMLKRQPPSPLKTLNIVAPHLEASPSTSSF